MNGHRILITGANGQLGWELNRTAPAGVDVVACNSLECDITNRQQVRAVLSECSPQVVINAAAYTAVDKAETDAERAFEVNSDGIAQLAETCVDVGARIIHISTDFVFDGRNSSPYRPSDSPNPTGVYGESKLAGEQRLLEIMPECTIIRTAWVYSSHGNNFVKTMLRLMAERQELGVVADQIGTPTWANGLARAIWQVVPQEISGVYHWTDAGVASWYDFACAIQEEALVLGILKKPLTLRPLQTKDYPTPAIRPPYSVLDKSDLWKKLGVTAPHWRVSLRKMLQEIDNE